MGGREKKISFQLYLNKQRKSPIRENWYKLYVRINFLRQSTKMPMHVEYGYEKYWAEADMEDYDNEPVLPSRLRGDVHEIKLSFDYYERVIRYEYARVGEGYQLKGIADRLRFYNQSFLYSTERKLVQQTAIVGVDKGVAITSSKEAWQWIVQNKTEIAPSLSKYISFYLTAYIHANFNAFKDEKLVNPIYFDRLFYYLIPEHEQIFRKAIYEFLDTNSSFRQWIMSQPDINNSPNFKTFFDLFPISEERYTYYLKCIQLNKIWMINNYDMMVDQENQLDMSKPFK